MSRRRLKFNIMTAALAPGDAISNYIFSKARLLRQMGAQVDVYADFIDPTLAHAAHHSSLYQSTGTAILWYHYSLYADNVKIAMDSDDFKIMDYHGICPPRLFQGQNEHLRHLCQTGLDVLPDFASHVERYVVHTDYTRDQLVNLGYAPEDVHKISLCVDTSRLIDDEDEPLAALLSRLDYFLFVGRVVPQKDILASLQIFAEVLKHRPNMTYVIVGTRDQTTRYRQQVDRFIEKHALTERVLFTGHVSNPALLAALFARATFYLATSEWESFCVPLAESLFFGVPTVVHDIPPLPEVAGPAGIVIDKHDPRSAARHILEVLEDGERYNGLAAAARQFAVQYTDQALARNLEQFLRHLAAAMQKERRQVA